MRNLISEKGGEDSPTHSEAAEENDIATGTITKVLGRQHNYEAFDEPELWRPLDTSDWRTDPEVFLELRDRGNTLTEYLEAATVDA